MSHARKIDSTIKRRTYSVLVENEPGVLARIAGLFSARGFNIASLAVGETLDASVSRMTIIADGTDMQLEQIRKQLSKLIPVISVRDLHKGEYVSSELLLIKLDKTEDAAKFIKKTGKSNDVQIIDESPEHYIIRAVKSFDDVGIFLKEIEKLGAVEISRTGQVAMAKKYRLGLKAKH